MGYQQLLLTAARSAKHIASLNSTRAALCFGNLSCNRYCSTARAKAITLLDSHLSDDLSIIAKATEQAKIETHPEQENAGKIFVQSKDGIRLATEQEVKEAAYLTLGGQDSSQTLKASMAIANISWALASETKVKTAAPNCPIILNSGLTTPEHKIVSARLHYLAHLGKPPEVHAEAMRFGDALYARYKNELLIDKGKIDISRIKPFTAFAYSAGAKHIFAIIQHIENNLCHDYGITRAEATKVIAETFRIAAVGVMPPADLLKMRPLNGLYIVSLFDQGTRPDLEAYKLVFGSPEVNERVKKEGIYFINIKPFFESSVSHTVAVVGSLVWPSKYGHNAKAYLETIQQHPLLAAAYRVLLANATKDQVDAALGNIREKSKDYKELEADETSLTDSVPRWKSTIIDNFSQQIQAYNDSKD